MLRQIGHLHSSPPCFNCPHLFHFNLSWFSLTYPPHVCCHRHFKCLSPPFPGRTPIRWCHLTVPCWLSSSLVTCSWMTGITKPGNTGYDSPLTGPSQKWLAIGVIKSLSNSVRWQGPLRMELRLNSTDIWVLLPCFSGFSQVAWFSTLYF